MNWITAASPNRSQSTAAAGEHVLFCAVGVEGQNPWNHLWLKFWFKAQGLHIVVDSTVKLSASVSWLDFTVLWFFGGGAWFMSLYLSGTQFLPEANPIDSWGPFGHFWSQRKSEAPSQTGLQTSIAAGSEAVCRSNLWINSNSEVIRKKPLLYRQRAEAVTWEWWTNFSSSYHE